MRKYILLIILFSLLLIGCSNVSVGVGVEMSTFNNDFNGVEAYLG